VEIVSRGIETCDLRKVLNVLYDMAMGTRKKRERQQDLWIATSAVVQSPGHAFYDRLNEILDEHHFDQKVEALCRKFYKKSPYGRPSVAPGVYFRALLIGYFGGLDSERAIRLAGRRFVVLAPLSGVRPGRGGAGPFHPLADAAAVLGGDAQSGVPVGAPDFGQGRSLAGATIAIDATTLEANAAMKSIVRREDGQAYTAYF